MPVLMLAAALAQPLQAPTPDTYSPSLSLAPLVQAVEPAVVAIEVVGAGAMHGSPFMAPPGQRSGMGSGFVISADGLVLTNHHVIDQARSLKVVFSDGERVEASVVGSDASMDIAVLQLPERAAAWPYVPLAADDSWKVGDWVVAIGNPLGLGMAATTGIVSGKGRVLHQDRLFGSDDFIQTDAAINPGNSGGPLFNLDGAVIGINSAIIAGANTIGFSIPVTKVRQILPDLKERGHVARGYLGLYPQPLTASLAQALGAQGVSGILVAEVFDDTPAQQHLRAGDVIVKVDDEPVDSPEDLILIVGNKRPGERVNLGIVREGERQSVSLVLAERPTEGATVR